MGFFLSVLYLVTYFLTPAVLFGPLVEVHIEIVLAVLILLVSLPKIMRSSVLRTPQALALAGLAVAVFLSVLIGVGWPSGAINAFFGFIPSMFAYFLIGLHCNSVKKLKILIVMLLFVCLFVIGHGMRDLRYAESLGAPSGSSSSQSVDYGALLLDHPYILPMTDDAGEWFFRIRGQGQINDPNDFGQVLICTIPLLFIFWRAKKRIRNLVFVILPSCALLYGIYLTHSRGALVALIVVVVVASRRKIGTLPAAVIAAGLFAAAMALHFTGGRAVSVDAGAGREDLWAAGLQMLISHPLFGVGFGYFMQYAENTAHNSIVVCAAELGLLGFYFWALFLLSTARNVLLIASPAKVAETESTESGDDLLFFKVWKGPELDKGETNHLGFCLLLSLTGFLAAGWFLSRAFVMTLFLLGGMIEAIYEEARRKGMVAPRLTLSRNLTYSLPFMIGLLMLVYLMLRISNLVR
jgi:O-antigen ligase